MLKFSRERKKRVMWISTLFGVSGFFRPNIRHGEDHTPLQKNKVKFLQVFEVLLFQMHPDKEAIHFPLLQNWTCCHHFYYFSWLILSFWPQSSENLPSRGCRENRFPLVFYYFSKYFFLLLEGEKKIQIPNILFALEWLITLTLKLAWNLQDFSTMRP